ATGMIPDNLSWTGTPCQSIVQLLVTLPWQSTSSAMPAPIPATSICRCCAQSRSCMARFRVSWRTASPPRAGRVGIIVRWRISPEGHDTTPPEIFVPPISNPMAPICCLLFICRPSVIVKMVTLLPFLNPKIKRRESRFHRNRPLLFRGLSARFYDFEQVNVMVKAVQRLTFFLECVHHLCQPVCPQPCWINRLELFPASRAVSPNLEAAWVPVIPEQVCCTFSSVKFQSRTPVALNAVTGNQG